MLREVAEKRLSAIREFTDLGSGVKIAMRDLEIRGQETCLGRNSMDIWMQWDTIFTVRC